MDFHLGKSELHFEQILQDGFPEFLGSWYLQEDLEIKVHT